MSSAPLPRPNSNRQRKLASPATPIGTQPISGPPLKRGGPGAYAIGVKTTDTQDTEEYGRGGTMPETSLERKHVPLATGFLDYFPDASIEVCQVSYWGNEKHNPGEPLHWARGKGGNNADEAIRHFMQRGRMDESDPPHMRVRHMAKCVWRMMAILQLEIEAERKAAGVPPTPPRTEVG